MNSSKVLPWLSGYKFTYLLVASLMLVLAPLIVGTSFHRSLLFGIGFPVVMLFGVFAVARHRRAFAIDSNSASSLHNSETVVVVIKAVFGNIAIADDRGTVFAKYPTAGPNAASRRDRSGSCPEIEV